MAESLREEIALGEHQQWIAWSTTVSPEVSPERRERWKTLWIPYSELTEEQKDQDRVWADKILSLILERVNGIDEPLWYEDWGGSSGQVSWGLAIQAVIKELQDEPRREAEED